MRWFFDYLIRDFSMAIEISASVLGTLSSLTILRNWSSVRIQEAMTTEIVIPDELEVKAMKVMRAMEEGDTIFGSGAEVNLDSQSQSLTTDDTARAADDRSRHDTALEDMRNYFVHCPVKTVLSSPGLFLVYRLRAFGRPYLAYHPGLLRDTLAFHGCAELFQDLHTELIQYRRKQMIKRQIVHEELNIDSVARRKKGSCPFMPEEVGLLLRVMGYPQNTIIYVAGSEIFGGQRVLVPLRAMYTNLVGHTSLSSKKELSDLVGLENPFPSSTPQSPAVKRREHLLEEWNRAGPRPRPLPPPPARPFYAHEHEGWYAWLVETETEPDPSPMDLRRQAHQLLWDALDYYVSVEADAFFPGFHNDGSGWPDFSNLVMGHRAYQAASRRTYRPDRKALFQLFDTIRDNLYSPQHNWTVAVRNHLNASLGIDGFITTALQSKPSSFLSHPFPECSCTTSSSPTITNPLKSEDGKLIRGKEDKCPEWMVKSLAMVSPKVGDSKDVDTEGSDSGDESRSNKD